jgi:hypothetical protein
VLSDKEHIMRLLRGLGSRLLPCGCLAGIYETYADTTVTIIDARGEHCTNVKHAIGEAIPVESVLQMQTQPSSHQPERAAAAGTSKRG